LHRARHLVGQVQAALRSTGNARTHFRRKLIVSAASLNRRINERLAPILYGAKLSVSELVGLTTWPTGAPHVAGLPRGQTRQLPASADVPTKGRVIGTSTFPGAERQVALSYKDATKHMHVL